MLRQEKRIQSSSFSKSASSLIPLEKSNSYSADKLTAAKGENRDEERNIVLKVIQSLNQKQNSEMEWRLNSFEEKRTISGYKCRLEWACPKKDMRVLFKMSFASSFFTLINHLNEGDIFMEIEELNFQLLNAQKKVLQQRFENILISAIENTRRKSFNDETKKQSECLRILFHQIGNELLKKCYENKKKIAIDKIDKNLCKKYMLYPAPATFSWNPLGSICITENKYPVNKKSFFGEPNSLRKYLQNNRLEATFSLQEEEGELGNNKESANSVFDWKIDQEIDLLIFQRDKSSKKDEKYYINRLRIEAEDPSRREQQKKDEEGITLAYLNRIQSPRLRKVYERYFGGEQISQFHRHDKLRVYDVRSFNKGYEDDIIHLLEKLALAPETPKLEILFQNQLSLFPGLLVNMDILKYRLMSGVIGSVIHFPNSKISFGRYLKIFILENEFWGGQIQKYFRQLYVNLKQKPHHLLYSLGAYNRFDYLRAELLFMDLLQKYLAVGQNVAVETHAELKGSIIRIRTKLKIPKFGLEGIISEIDKNTFLMNLFPVLIVKDREMEKFEYKQIKRIVTANSKLFFFAKRMNQIISKLQQGKIGFVHSIIEQFRRFREPQEGDDPSGIEPRRLFLLHCASCQRSNRAYQLLNKNQLELCPRCKQKVFSQSL